MQHSTGVRMRPALTGAPHLPLRRRQAISFLDTHVFHQHINHFQLVEDPADSFGGYFQKGDWHDSASPTPTPLPLPALRVLGDVHPRPHTCPRARSWLPALTVTALAHQVSSRPRLGQAPYA